MSTQNAILNQFLMKSPPSVPDNIATKRYVDRIMWPEVIAASTAPITATSYDGQTLAGAGEFPDVDDAALGVGNRVLLKDQVDSSENGIYVVTASDAGTGWRLDRPDDADETGHYRVGKSVYVVVGSVNEKKTLSCTEYPASNDFDGPVHFEEAGGSAPVGYSEAITLEDGTTEYQVSHGLNTVAVMVQIMAYSPYGDTASVHADIDRPDENTVRIVFDADAVVDGAKYIVMVQPVGQRFGHPGIII